MDQIDPTRDYYADLELSPPVDAQAIRRQWLALALRYHPDKTPDSPSSHQKFLEARDAYEVLSNEGQKKYYNRTGDPHGASSPGPRQQAEGNGDEGWEYGEDEWEGAEGKDMEWEGEDDEGDQDSEVEGSEDGEDGATGVADGSEDDEDEPDLSTTLKDRIYDI